MFFVLKKLDSIYHVPFADGAMLNIRNILFCDSACSCDTTIVTFKSMEAINKSYHLTGTAVNRI